MKGFFLLLLAANLLLWSAWNGWLGTDAYQLVNPAHTEPMRLQQQVQPQRVIVGELALRNALPPPGNEKPAIAVCLEIGPFSPADAKTNLQSLAADFSLSNERIAPAPSGFLVYLPAQASRAQSEALVQNLKSRGEKEAAVILEGSPLLYAISLGTYRTQDAATTRTAALNAAGITGTRILQRSERSPRHYVQVFEVNPEQRSKLDGLAQQSGLEWRACNGNTNTNAPAPKGR